MFAELNKPAAQLKYKQTDLDLNSSFPSDDSRDCWRNSSNDSYMNMNIFFFFFWKSNDKKCKAVT